MNDCSRLDKVRPKNSPLNAINLGIQYTGYYLQVAGTIRQRYRSLSAQLIRQIKADNEKSNDLSHRTGPHPGRAWLPVWPVSQPGLNPYPLSIFT